MSKSAEAQLRRFLRQVYTIRAFETRCIRLYLTLPPRTGPT
jgi:hypothetical protein